MKSIRIIAIAALVYLFPGALLGAYELIAQAHGTPFGLFPQSLLQYSPFHSYLIPGLLLLAANGLLPIWVLALVLGRKRLYGLWTAFQGCVLLGFLVIECWMLHALNWAHFLYGAVALVLIVCGFALRREPAA